MVQDYHSPEGSSSEGERRKTAILREGPPRAEYAQPRNDEPSRASGTPPVKAVAGGSSLQTLAGICAAVLAIIAIAGSLPETLIAIAIIVIGGAVLLGAGGVFAMFGRRRTVVGGEYGTEATVGGSAFQALCGAAAVAGGILALANVVPMTLLPISVIVLGASALAGSGGLHFLNLSWTGGSGTSMAAEATRQATVAASGAGIVVGEGAVALGVLALAGVSVFLLTEVAVLALGLGLMAGGAALAAHSASVAA